MITMQVAVGAAAPPQVTNSATVATPGDNNPGNNSASLTSPVTPQPSHVVRIAPTSGPQNGTAQAPIELVAQGDENALSFSLTFDQTVLTYQQGELGSGAAGATLNINDSQKASGKLGAALTLPAGQSFTGGTKQIVLVTFDIAPSATPDSTSVDFGDQPVARGISNVQAIPLPATWTAGTVTITCGLEGDVTPRPYGNGLITTTDWVQLGRFAAGLNTPATECEFQRADCAPRFILGNGAITTADWVQVGRYAAGLDPLTPAGGPTAPTAAGAATAMTRLQTVTVQPTVAEGGRNLMVEDVRIGRGQSGRVRIHLQAQGDENALGFSLRFDPRSLSLEGAEPGAGTSGALLTVNDRAKADGRLGVLLGLPAGRVFATGRQEVLVLSFQAKEAAATSTVEFMEGPVRLEISDAAGNALPAEYQGGRAEVRPGTSRRR
jgi:hypothetical protein